MVALLKSQEYLKNCVKFEPKVNMPDNFMAAKQNNK